MTKIPRVPVENQITILNVVNIAIKLSQCNKRMFIEIGKPYDKYGKKECLSILPNGSALTAGNRNNPKKLKT